MLIAKGADVNAKDEGGETPLDLASLKGRAEIADLLRKHGSKYGTIHGAAKSGDIEAVKQHLAAGTDVNAKHDAFGITPLHLTTNKDLAELLIAKGANVNAKTMRSETPLDFANRGKQTEIADLLRKHGGKTKFGGRASDIER